MSFSRQSAAFAAASASDAARRASPRAIRRHLPERCPLEPLQASAAAVASASIGGGGGGGVSGGGQRSAAEGRRALVLSFEYRQLAWRLLAGCQCRRHLHQHYDQLRHQPPYGVAFAAAVATASVVAVNNAEEAAELFCYEYVVKHKCNLFISKDVISDIFL